MCGFLVVGSEEFELQVFQKALDKAAYRGPDYQHVSIDHGITWGFNRLSIMDLSTNGNQPFVYKDYTLVCNGEIYNYPALKTKLESSYTFKSGSDCEVLIPLYEQYGLEILCKYLDAEFALVLYDNKTKQLMAARDPMGIRPMFYGYSKKEHQICFASEAKALFDLCDDIMPFPPGHYYLDGQFVCYNDLSDPKTIVDGTAVKQIGETPFEYIKKYVDEIVTVSDYELMEAFLLLVEKHKLIAEGSGILSLAALKKLHCKRKKVVSLISGGNMDVMTISSMINKGLISRGRILTFSVQLQDIPGQLEVVSHLLNECNANVIGVEHNQFKNFARFSEVELRVTCETNGEAHIQAIADKFKENGYIIQKIN